MQLINLGKALAVSAALGLFAVPASAQDDEDGPLTYGDDAKYITATLVKFKPGKRERALQIIDEHFSAAGKKAGLPGPLGVIHYQTGEWDALFVWNLEGGTADLEWYRSANSIKWRAALAEQEGVEEAAAALLAEYGSLVDEAETDLGHYHDAGEDSDD